MRRDVTSRDWFGTASAGLLLGFLLALGASGMLRWMLGIREAFFSTPGQASMWLMAPVWSLVLGFSFLFASTARAWSWLGGATLLLWAILLAVGALA